MLWGILIGVIAFFVLFLLRDNTKKTEKVEKLRAKDISKVIQYVAQVNDIKENPLGISMDDIEYSFVEKYIRSNPSIKILGQDAGHITFITQISGVNYQVFAYKWVFNSTGFSVKILG